MAVGATHIDKLILELEIRDKKLFAGFRAMDKVMKDIDKDVKKAQKSTSAFEKGFKNLQGAMLGVGLSFLFTGMAIARFFKTMLQSLFQTFLMVEGEGGIVNNTLGEMQAKLAFLKFLFVDAFMESGLLDIWIDRLERLLDFFIALDDDAKATLVDLAVAGFLFGLGLMVLGQVILGILGPLTILWFMFQFGLLPAFAALLITLLVLGAAWRILESDMNPVMKLLSLFAVILGGIVVIAAIFGVAISLPFVIAAAVIAVVISSILLMSRHVGGLGNAFKAFGIFVLAIFAAIGDAIIGTILAPLRAFIALINLAIAAANKIPGVNLGPGISQPESFKLSKKVFEMRNELLREGNAPNAPSEGGGVTNVFNIEGVIGDKESIADFIATQLNDRINFTEGSTQK